MKLLFKIVFVLFFTIVSCQSVNKPAKKAKKIAGISNKETTKVYLNAKNTYFYTLSPLKGTTLLLEVYDMESKELGYSKRFELGCAVEWMNNNTLIIQPSGGQPEEKKVVYLLDVDTFKVSVEDNTRNKQ